LYHLDHLTHFEDVTRDGYRPTERPICAKHYALSSLNGGITSVYLVYQYTCHDSWV